MKVRKWVMFLSAFAILISTYELKIQKIPWLEIEIPESGPNILPGSISIALLYFFIVFVFYAVIDLQRWSQAGAYVHLNSYWDLILGARQSVHNIAHFLESGKVGVDGTAFQASIQRTSDQAMSFFDTVSLKVAEIKGRHQRLTLAQTLRLVSLDIGIPVILAFIAIYMMAPSIVPFLKAIFAGIHC